MKINLRIYFLTVMMLWFISCSDSKSGKTTFYRQLGTYALDLRKISLGSYSKDSSLYKHLRISFLEDSTFIMNMKVPFMYDSIGKWIAGDGSPYSYNQLYYKSFNYGKVSTGDHFYPPYLENSDSIFLINAPTPQNGGEVIKELYFKKQTR
jgi:hypothetical protein